MAREVTLPTTTGNFFRDQIFVLINSRQDQGASFESAWEDTEKEAELFEKARALDASKRSSRVAWTVAMGGHNAIKTEWNKKIAAFRAANPQWDFTRAYRAAKDGHPELHALLVATA